MMKCMTNSIFILGAHNAVNMPLKANMLQDINKNRGHITD